MGGKRVPLLRFADSKTSQSTEDWKGHASCLEKRQRVVVDSDNHLAFDLRT
jgi:hypothetical protein